MISKLRVEVDKFERYASERVKSLSERLKGKTVIINSGQYKGRKAQIVAVILSSEQILVLARPYRLVFPHDLLDGDLETRTFRVLDDVTFEGWLEL